LPKTGVIAGIEPEKKRDQDSSEIGARDGRGNAGADHAERREAPMAENEKIVAEEIDDVGGNERDGDRPHEIHSLEGAAEGEVEEQGQQADSKRVHIGRGKDSDVRGHAEARKEAGEKESRNEKDRCEKEAEINPVHEGVVAVITPAGAKGLRDERVEADQKALAEEDEDEIEAGADAHGGNRLRAVGKTTDHHGIHDGHGDPTDFG